MFEKKILFFEFRSDKHISLMWPEMPVCSGRIHMTEWPDFRISVFFISGAENKIRMFWYQFFYINERHIEVMWPLPWEIEIFLKAFLQISLESQDRNLNAELKIKHIFKAVNWAQTSCGLQSVFVVGAQTWKISSYSCLTALYTTSL